MLRLALEFHALLAREGQIGSVPGAALALTVATLAVVHHHRLSRDFITDRAAGASAGVGFTHVFSPSILPAGDGADVLDKFLPGFAHGLESRIVVRRDEISFSKAPNGTRSSASTSGPFRSAVTLHARPSRTCPAGRHPSP